MASRNSWALHTDTEPELLAEGIEAPYGQCWGCQLVLGKRTSAIRAAYLF